MGIPVPAKRWPAGSSGRRDLLSPTRPLRLDRDVVPLGGGNGLGPVALRGRRGEVLRRFLTGLGRREGIPTQTLRRGMCERLRRNLSR